jgi:hypothetical protein
MTDSGMEMYDPSSASPSWTVVSSAGVGGLLVSVTSAPCQTNAATTCLYSIDIVFVNDYVTVLKMYDPSSLTPAWTDVDMGTGDNFGRTNVVAGVHGPCQGNSTKTCLYALLAGGDTLMYDPSSAAPSWTDLGVSLNTPREGLAAADGPCQTNPAKTCLYAIGGFPGVFVATVEMFELSPRICPR